MEPDQAFGQALRSLRTRHKWSQTEFALRADIDRNYISLIELGKNSSSVRLMLKPYDALDVSPSDLLKDVEKRLRAQTGGDKGFAIAVRNWGYLKKRSGL